MKHNTILEINNNDAFVAFSRPNEDAFELHFTSLFYGEMSDNNIRDFDFVIMPFSGNDEMKVYLKYKKSFYNQPFNFISEHSMSNKTIAKSTYLEDVNLIIKKIKYSELRKVVYSRVKKIPNTKTNLGELFIKIKNKYPSAFCFIYNIPNLGCWLGATPELLVKKKNKVIQTVALAGTQEYFENGMPVTWGKKESDEQAFIKDFIKSQLDALSLKYFEGPTETKVAGQVCHIFTNYNISHAESSADLINALHPGPAISGSPKQAAIQFIHNIEHHERKYYTGYLGELKNDNFDLYINLRSMEVSKDAFYLYLGGGITQDSVAEDEWDETELKSQTMLNVIL